MKTISPARKRAVGVGEREGGGGHRTPVCLAFHEIAGLIWNTADTQADKNATRDCSFSLSLFLSLFLMASKDAPSDSRGRGIINVETTISRCFVVIIIKCPRTDIHGEMRKGKEEREEQRKEVYIFNII